MGGIAFISILLLLYLSFNAYAQHRASVPDSSTTPAYSWSTDTSTGMWRPAASNIGFATGGNERLRIDQNGNVGIGTTSPGSKVDVNGVISTAGSYEGISSYTNSTAAYSVPDTSLNIRRITLNANATITLPVFTAPAGRMFSLTLFIKQDAIGSRTLAIAGAGGDTIKWDSGTTPVISPTADRITILQFVKASDENIWYGSMVWKEN